MEKKSSIDLKKFGLCLLVAIVIVGCLVAYWELRPPLSGKQDVEAIGVSGQPEFSISAVDLISEFNNNGVKADADYKGRYIAVTGKITSIDRDIRDKPYIMLNDTVQCFFSNEEEIPNLENYSVDDTVTIAGVCSDFLIYVTFEDCKLPK